MTSTAAAVEEISRVLRAHVQGSYVTHQAIIKLGKDASFWLDENEPTLARLAVFLHEYAHYLHNFSTVTGVYEFILQLRCLRLFMNTVGISGTSYGDTKLKFEEKTELDALGLWRHHLAGGVKSAGHGLKFPQGQLSVKEVRTGREKISVIAQEVEALWGEVDVFIVMGAKQPQPRTIRIGSEVLMEGIAWEIERLLFISQGEDTADLDARIPDYPYKLARVVFEEISKYSPTSSHFARVILLALQSSNPGFSFLELAGIAGRLHAQGSSAADISDQLVTDMGRLTQGHIEDLVLKTLDVEIEAFRTRGPVGLGLDSMVARCKTLLQLRRDKPFFELELIEAGLEQGSLVDLIKMCPPCPVIQQTGPSTGDIEYMMLSAQPIDQAELGALGAAQGLIQFANSHIGRNSIAPTTGARGGPCRFLGACDAPFAKQRPDSCIQRPWESFSPGTGNGCWYATGVAHSRARADLA